MNIAIPFRPKLFETLKNYSGALFRRDFGAGLNVMVMAFPLSVAFAIASGAKPVVLAALLMVKRVSETSQITAVDESTETEGSHHSLVGKQVPDGVLIFRVFGAFFFGVVDKLDDELKRAKQEPDVLILRVRKVLAMDATGVQALEDLLVKLRAKGKHLILSAPHTQPLLVMEKAGFFDRIGRENVCPHIDAALARAREILGLPLAPETDPLHQERQKLEAVRRELTGALERANEVMRTPVSGSRALPQAAPATNLRGNGKPN